MEKYCDLCDKKFQGCSDLIEDRTDTISSYLCDSCIKELYEAEKPKVSLVRRIFEVILFVAINIFIVFALLYNFGDSTFKQLLCGNPIMNGNVFFWVALICVILGIILFILSVVKYFIRRNKNEK